MLTRRRFSPLACFALFLLCSCAHRIPDTVEARIARVETGLLEDYGDPPSRRRKLEDRMAFHKVPGVSIAVIHDFRVDWAKGYGVVDVESGKPVRIDSLFQGASIGKVLVASAVLQLADEGLLDLDESVNTRLRSWRVPESDLTSKEKVTLRRLLSHNAGVTVEGFGGYPRGERLPSLLQILDGEPPANSAPIRVDSVPGSTYRYSSGGYMIVQQLLEDVTGVALAEHVKQAVFGPARMTTSTFEAPLPAGEVSRAAVGHRADGQPIPGGWHDYPEAGSGASLWSTPTDLARFAISFMRAFAGKRGEVISPRAALEMLTPVVGDRGLGPVIGDDGGDRFYFMHPGANEGFRCVMVVYPKRGQGVVIMTNSDSGDTLWREVLRSVSVCYGWVSGWFL